MFPNMFKIAGELTSAVLHVASRAIATQGLSIFGDHSDVMATRASGFALLAAASVQEAMDFALIAQAATLAARIPFLHFFDGFRTSHEVAKVELLTDDDLRAMLDESHVFFQSRETVIPYYSPFAPSGPNSLHFQLPIERRPQSQPLEDVFLSP
jgi:pyruvate-ferredoxin/flavodoxin oxidoreductase